MYTTLSYSARCLCVESNNTVMESGAGEDLKQMHKDHRDKLKSVKSKICRDASLPFSPRSGGGPGGGVRLGGW
jgi:hypothetical protein